MQHKAQGSNRNETRKGFDEGIRVIEHPKYAFICVFMMCLFP